MDKNDKLSSNQLQILHICEALYLNEIIYQLYMKDYDYTGYLIENKIVEKIKKKVNYEKLKPLIVKSETYDKYKKEIKETQDKIEEIIPKQYKNSKGLIRELLNDNKSFYLIKQDYLSKITDKSKLSGKEIKFKFHNESIILFFNDNDTLNFNNAKKDGILEKGILDKAISTNNPHTNENQNNVVYTKQPNDNIKFNKDLEILIRMFYFNKYLKENDAFQILNNENGESVYLIHNSWMEEYKSFFDYQSLENYLKEKKEYSDQTAQNKDYLNTDSKIEEIIKSLPVEYIIKINKKTKFDIKKDFKYEYNQNKNGINYLSNNHILNNKAYQLLKELNYILNDSIKNFTLYFVGCRKLLLYSNQTDINKEKYVIGTIDEKGIFIPEYLLKYNQNDISLEKLNIIMKNYLFNFYSTNNNDERCDLIFENIKTNTENKQVKIKEVIGHCYRLKKNAISTNINNNGASEGNNSTNVVNPNNIIDNQTSQFPADSELINRNQEGESNNPKKEINKYIELLIDIFLLKNELKNKINSELKNTFEEKYYIINKKWMDDLKHLFDYDTKFLNYLNSGKLNDIINKFNPIDKYVEFLTEIMNLLDEGYINEINSKMNVEKIKEITSVYNNSSILIEKNHIYFYDNNIELLNEQTKNILERIFNIEICEKKIFLFGDNKIIMNLDYDTQYSLITGDYNDHFQTKLLFHFYTRENVNFFLKKFTSDGYENTISKLVNIKEQNNIYIKGDNSNIIGQIYTINDLENNFNTNNINTNANSNNGSITTPKDDKQNNLNEQSSKSKIIINLFLKNQIKALISYSLFIEKLQQNIKSSKIINSECYLIEENWMKNYTKILFYEEIKQQIRNNNITEDIEKIYEKLDDEYLKKIKDNENKICKDINDIELSKKLDIFESPNSNDIVKYNNIKFYIIDKETYEYMNLAPQKKAIIAKNKEYLINCSKIFINLLNESLFKFEILICCLDMTDNILIPELLFKYYSKILMMHDLDFWKKNDYMKFRNERKLSTNNELIIKNSKNEKVGIIYDLKSPNLLELINTNNTNIKKNQSQNNRAQDAINQKTDKTESKLITNFQQDINSSENKANLRGIPKTNIQNNFDGTKTIQIFEAMNQPQFKLDDMKNKHIEFLLRYQVFEEKLNAKIKNFMFHKEKCFIINYQLIDCFKDFYQLKQLFHFFKSDTNMKKIYEKYLNKYKYKYIGIIEEESFINETLQNLPKDYIQEIQGKNNSQFLSNLQNIDLYRPLYSKFIGENQFYYFYNCILINVYLAKFALSLINVPDKNNILQNAEYVISNGQLFLKHNLNIYFGNLNNDKAIFKPEIMICFQNENEINGFINGLMNKQMNINSILQQTKRIDNNNPYIGSYNNTNIQVIIINQQNYTINQKQEAFQQPTKINREIKDEIKCILNVLIDFIRIKKKIKIPLNKNTGYDKYYLINNEWMKKYLEYYNLASLYNNQIILQTLDETINNNNLNSLSNDDIIENAKYKNEFIYEINNISKNIPKTSYINGVSINPAKIIINDLFSYFNNFSLVEGNTWKKLNNYNYNKNEQSYIYYCYFGDNKIFIYNEGNNSYSIKIYSLDNYEILPEVFYKYNGANELHNSLNLLKENGYLTFSKYYLMFNNDNNDLASPIFDQSNKEIGYAYKYSPYIKDYSPYIISNDYKTMLKLYFYYIKLRTQSISKNNGNFYLLINSDFFRKYKEYYEYPSLENFLSNNNIVQQIVKNIKENNDYILNDKILTLIIKNLPNNINQKFIEKNKYKPKIGNISEEPTIKGIQNSELFYYDEFELINEELYYLIFNKKDMDINGKCFFINDYVCVKMPKKINIKSNNIFIFGSLNSNHLFKTKYLLEYNSVKDFKNQFNYTNQMGGFDKYILSFQFKNNYIEELTDLNNQSLGLIYNLDINNNNNIIEATDIKIEFYKSPLIGLKKVESFPSMNAILQCLCQNEKLVNYFKYNKHLGQMLNNFNMFKLTKSFKNIIDNLWPSNRYNINLDKNENNHYYNPVEFQNKLSSMKFKSYNKNNECKDLIEFILMNLHEELNKKDINNNILMQNNNNCFMDKSNQNLMLSIFVQQFMNNNKSIISDLFYWTNQIIIQCMNCGIKSYEYQTNSILIFSIEEIYKYKYKYNFNQNRINMSINQNLINIFDCFDFYQRTETMFGEDAIPCNYCKNICNSNYTCYIYTSPEIFILILDKPKNSDIKLQFFEELNLSNYILINKIGCQYRLFGVVSETNERNGHFISYVRNPIDWRWYKYDDEYVYPINNFTIEVIDSSNPCVLFYQKISYN